MSIKDELKEVFSRYPFVHLDQAGELLILVPLTGAQTITDAFGTKPISLFLFGDNTCKADLERRKFFEGTASDRYTTKFDDLFHMLNLELEQLKSRVNVSSDEREFLQEIINKLHEQKRKAKIFHGHGNPGYRSMYIDHEYGEEIFVSKGEFIVDTNPDGARYFPFPNVRNLVSNVDTRLEKLIHEKLLGSCLVALSQVKKVAQVDRLSLIPMAIKEIRDEAKDNIKDVIKSYLCDEKDETKQELQGGNPEALFRLIYNKLQNQDASLEDQNGQVFKNMAYYWSFLKYDSTWKDKDIIDGITAVFKQAKILSSVEDVKQKTFAVIYQKCSEKYIEENSDANKTGINRRDTYNLFVLQTFLYLCVIEMRLKNKETAKKFLKVFQDREELNNLIHKLCTNEVAFIKMMNDEYQLSVEEYHSIADAAHEIGMSHIEAPHFDELRIACSPESLHNAQYIVMGGRLCWSTTPITENTNLNTLEKQKAASASNFETFYEQRASYIKQNKSMRKINDLFKNKYSEEVVRQIKEIIPLLSLNQKNDLVINAIENKNYQYIHLVIANSKNELFTHAFVLAMRAYPINTDLISGFLDQNDKYSKHIQGNDLINAVRDGDLRLVKLILKCRPELLEYEDQARQTPFLWACSAGKVEIVKHFMLAGANIHARTMIPLTYEYNSKTPYTSGKTAKKWAEELSKKQPENSKLIQNLFDKYYENFEENFKTDPEYKNNFNSEHLGTAIKNGDLKLINIYLTYCPHLKDFWRPECAVLAKQQKAQQELLDQITPHQNTFRLQIEELQRKLRDLKSNYGIEEPESIMYMQSLSDTLVKEGNRFFLNPITPRSFQLFQNECKKALDIAKPVLANHRGWYTYPRFIRGVLGVLSAIAIIPALVFMGSSKGYIKTFFGKKEEVKTDSIEKLDHCEKQLDNIGEDIVTKLKNEL